VLAISSPAVRSTSLEQYNKKHLADLKSLPGMENFSPVAKAAWTHGRRFGTFCVPMASVIHGFIYNKDAFDKLGIAVPATEAEFFAALDKIKGRHLYPAGHGHEGSLGSRNHGLPEHRPELLEG
jgi:ABC-type glycerol-3-phosphate transport system substrate-binding protein